MKGRILFIWFCIHFHWAESQVIIPSIEDKEDHYVYLNMGFEPQIVSTIGYSHLLNTSNKKIRMHLGSNIKTAPLADITSAWRIGLNQMLQITTGKHWVNIISNDFYLAHNKNRAGRMNGLGFNLNASAINVKNKWSKGIIAGWQHTAFTQIQHSEAVKDTYKLRYPSGDNVNGPIDGWYKSTVNRLRLGAIFGRSLNETMNIQFELGSQIAIQKQGLVLSFAHAQVPVYLHVQIVYRW